jgi:hypothetical protein
MAHINAKVIADSVGLFGDRLFTPIVTFPRMILAELNTHRMLSKNSASSRAIPFKKMVKAVEENPFIPVAWQCDHSGMQGFEYFDNIYRSEELAAWWLGARNKAIAFAKDLNKIGVTKQLCNRLLEPFMWHKVLISGSEWENFFHLRCPQYEISENIFRSKKDAISQFPICQNDTVIEWLKRSKAGAEIHMQLLAEAIWDAYNESTPKKLEAGEWHLPYGDNLYYDPYVSDIKISTANCARTSYTVIEDKGIKASYETLINIHDKMVNSNPLHASPFEHPARCMSKDEYFTHKKAYTVKEITEDIQKDVDMGKTSIIQDYNNGYYVVEYGWCGNLRGFIQYRKMLQNENKR